VRLARVLAVATAVGVVSFPSASRGAGAPVWEVREYAAPAGSHPHDVAPAPDGGVWYTEQAAGALGRLDPRTGRSRQVPLGAGSAPTA
jgi:virginiamycin B lyase